MRKLIDSEEYAKRMDADYPEYWEDVLDETPEVEAIPVSWIEERIINAEDAGQTLIARMWLELINGYRREQRKKQ